MVFRHLAWKVTEINRLLLEKLDNSTIGYQWEVSTIVTNAKLHLWKVKKMFLLPWKRGTLSSFAFNDYYKFITLNYMMKAWKLKLPENDVWNFKNDACILQRA